MKHPLDAPRAGPDAEQIERQLAKLTKINAALMQRVEKSMDQQANAFSLFQTAITLEGQVRVRTEELKNALSHLEHTNDELTSARDTSERANRFKTRFFTAVGHDLLQPLHAARLSVSALTDPSSTPEQRSGQADAVPSSMNLSSTLPRRTTASSPVDELRSTVMMSTSFTFSSQMAGRRTTTSTLSPG